MICIDTSLWIDMLKNTLDVDEHKAFVRFIEDQEGWSPDVVFGELLQGVKNKKEAEIISAYANICTKQNTISWAEAGAFSSEHKLISFGVGLIDSFILLSAKKMVQKFGAEIRNYYK